MDKPQKESIIAFDFNECTKYIEDKYDIDVDEYCGLWNWIVDYCDIHNGCYFWICANMCDSMTDKQKEVIKMYMDEFGEKDQIFFYVSW